MNESPVRDYLGGITVICPEEKKYGDADIERFKQTFNTKYIHSNLKLIGIGEGAAFVSKKLQPIAEPFSAVVTISSREIKKQGLKEIVAKAWEEQLCRSYKLSNYEHTTYMGDKFGMYPYEEEEYMIPQNYGMKKNIVEQNLVTRRGNYLWFEYYNKEVEDAEPKSIPLMVLLHGNGNDPRTQAETSGFVQLASRKNFMVIELEWQGTDNIHEWMGLDGIELVVNTVLAKYPQLDPGRVYAEGLSAGGFCATALGIHKSYLFAGVVSHSGGVVSEKLNEGVLYSTGINQASLWGDAAQKRGKVQTAFLNISGTCDDAVIFPTASNYASSESFAAWELYRFFEGAEPVEAFDPDADSVFGQELDNRQTSQLKGFTLESGDVVVDGVPVMRLIAVMKYGHWNFAPAAPIIWDYLCRFSRDEFTRELKYIQ